LVGVLNKKFSSTNRLHGVTVTLSNVKLEKQEQTVRLLLDANKKTLTVWTHTEQQVVLLKESGTLIPAI
jgi:hypothetical protein